MINSNQKRKILVSHMVVLSKGSKREVSRRQRLIITRAVGEFV